MPRFRALSNVEVEAVQWRIGGAPFRALLKLTVGTDARVRLELSDGNVLLVARDERWPLVEGDWLVLQGKKISVVPDSVFVTQYESVAVVP